MATPSSALAWIMDIGAWRDTVHGVARVGHGLGTKPPPKAILGALWPLLYFDSACGFLVSLRLSNSKSEVEL